MVIQIFPIDSNLPGRISVRVVGPHGEDELFIASENWIDHESMSCWLPALLPIAMSLGQDLFINGGLDARSLENSAKAQLVLKRWFPKLKNVEVHSEFIQASGTAINETGCFFTGGVDSFYSSLILQNRPSKLIFVNGFDIPLSNDELTAKTVEKLQAAAHEMGKELVVLSTNIREYADKYVSWGEQYHGAALASIGLSLKFREISVASSFSTKDLHPWGSHPALDHLWSSNFTSIRHDSVSVPRIEKVRFIAQSSTAMKYLRVCWENPNNSYNCGRCEKCLRTMINLQSVGRLQEIKTLPHVIPLEDVNNLKLGSISGLIFLKENLSQLKKNPVENIALINALKSLTRQRVILINLNAYLKKYLPSWLIFAMRSLRSKTK
jgi:hypothetical protein